MNKAKNIVQNNIFRIVLGTAIILMIPWVGSFPWTLIDYVTMGALLLSAGFAYELISKRVKREHKIIVAILILATVFLIWAELAVGLFGTPIAGS